MKIFLHARLTYKAIFSAKNLFYMKNPGLNNIVYKIFEHLRQAFISIFKIKTNIACGEVNPKQN